MAIYFADQNKNKIRLLQSSKAKLSTFKSNEGKIKTIINCSFFNGSYVIGRNQGDEKNDTVDQTNFEGNNLVIFKDNTYKIGKFNSWDYQENVVAGFCPCAIFRNGQLEVAPTLKDKWSPNSIINRTAICYNDNGFHFCVATNINYQDFANQIYEKYKAHFIAFLDSSGSSEFIDENGKLAFTPSDGVERDMFNGLAFVEVEEPTPEPEPSENQSAIFPARCTWVSQEMGGALSHIGIKAIDFGTWGAANKKRLGLPSDYDYPLYAPFDCKVVYADSVSKGGTVALESLTKVKYSNGELDYATLISEHSLDRPALGTIFKQGDLYAHFGTAGGVKKHLHIEVIKGRFSEIYKNKSIAVTKQSIGNVYKFEQTIEPYNCLFKTKDTIIEGEKDGSVSPYTWKNVGEEETEIDKLKKEISSLKQTIAEKETTIINQLNIIDKLNDKLIRLEGLLKQGEDIINE